MRISGKVVVGAVSVWILLYLVAYIIYLRADGNDTNLQELMSGDASSSIRGQMLNIVRGNVGHMQKDSGDANPFVVSSKTLGSAAGAIASASASAGASAVAGSGNGASASPVQFTASVPAFTFNPFVSDMCQVRISNILQSSIALAAGGADAAAAEKDSDNSSVAPQSVAVIIPVFNERPEILLHTVKSIFENSGSELKTVVVVDDSSSTSRVSDWPGWKGDPQLLALLASRCSGGNTKQCLRLLRTKSRLGVSGAKAFGADIFTAAHGVDHFHDNTVSTLVFVDAHVVVSPRWLLPLVHTLKSNLNSVVYPTIDIVDPASGRLARAADVVGGFGWDLQFRWENASTAARLPHGTDPSFWGTKSKIEEDIRTAPASPGIFAIRTAFFKSIGGFDTALKPWGQENIELSLRVWMCGGSVIHQPCSRVAHRYDNVFAAAYAGGSQSQSQSAEVRFGVTQRDIDVNVMRLAERWFSGPAYLGVPDGLREVVYKARFLGRVPYTVPVPADSRMPALFKNVPLITEGKCSDIAWYLKEVYPGLLADRQLVEANFAAQVSDPAFLAGKMAPVLQQYRGKHDHIGGNSAPQSLQEVLQARGHSAQENALAKAADSLIPDPVYSASNRRKHNGVQAVSHPVEIFLSDTHGDAHEEHANSIRQSMLCKDEVFPAVDASGNALPKKETCAERVARGACAHDKYYMMFGCPASCGWCAADGTMCVDFFENKCPVYKKDGRCDHPEEAHQMQHDCSYSCRSCKPPGGVKGFGSGDDSAAVAAAVAAAKAQVAKSAPAAQQGDAPKPAAPAAAAAAANANELVASMDLVNHRKLQQDWAAGLLPDHAENACKIRDSSDGQLLSLVQAITPQEPTYTTTAAAAAAAGASGDAGSSGGHIRIFCGIYTMEKNHGGNVRATRETWAKKCDGFVAFSTVSDPALPAIAVLHEGEESYDNMWQKSRSIWKYIALHLREEYDYFLLGGDDMFYIVENLRAYLQSAEIVAARVAADAAGGGLFLGRRFFPPKQEVFNSGGAGYLLDAAAVKLLGENIDTPKCFPHQHGFWEDVNVANCLRASSKSLPPPAGRVQPYDTRDSQKRERFHPFTPGHMFTYRDPSPKKDWFVDYHPELQFGDRCCSPESISFHYVPHDLMVRLYAFMYHCSARGDKGH